MLTLFNNIQSNRQANKETTYNLLKSVARILDLYKQKTSLYLYFNPLSAEIYCKRQGLCLDEESVLIVT